MTKKLFFYKINQMESHKLRLINKVIIPKSIIRDFIEDDTKIKILDNSYSINDIVLKDKNKKRTIISKDEEYEEYEETAVKKKALWNFLSKEEKFEEKSLLIKNFWNSLSNEEKLKRWKIAKDIIKKKTIHNKEIHNKEIRKRLGDIICVNVCHIKYRDLEEQLKRDRLLHHRSSKEIRSAKIKDFWNYLSKKKQLELEDFARKDINTKLPKRKRIYIKEIRTRADEFIWIHLCHKKDQELEEQLKGYSFNLWNSLSNKEKFEEKSLLIKNFWNSLSNEEKLKRWKIAKNGNERWKDTAKEKSIQRINIKTGNILTYNIVRWTYAKGLKKLSLIQNFWNSLPEEQKLNAWKAAKKEAKKDIKYSLLQTTLWNVLSNEEKALSNLKESKEIEMLMKDSYTSKIIGKSLKVDNHILRHRLWHTLQLNVPLIYNQKSINLTINFVKKFSLFFQKKGVLTSILKAKKGGFSARSFGILGFLPLKEYKKLKLSKLATDISKKLMVYKNNKIKIKFTKQTWQFQKMDKLSLWQKVPLRANKKKWKFLIKNRTWFRKIKEIKNKKKKISIKAGDKWIKARRNILKNKRVKMKKNLSPFIFYKNFI